MPWSMNVVIKLRSSSMIRWLRNELRTSSPRKLGKTWYLPLLEEEEEEEEAMESDREEIFVVKHYMEKEVMH